MTDENLVSVRGLVDSDFENPLREFSGTFGGYDTAPASGYVGTRADLKFKDLDDVVATSPYIFPTASINVGLSNKHKSRWGYLADSVAPLIPEDEDLKDQIDKRFHCVFCDGQGGRPAMKPIFQKTPAPELLEKYPDKQIPTAVWIVTEIAGVTAGLGKSRKKELTATEIAEELLIGKTRVEFNKEAYAHPAIRKDVALQRSITDKSFINTLIQLGKITEDENGVFQKV